MPSHHPRCVQHGLVVATDNMCVLCRKEARLASQPPKEERYHLPLTAAELTAGGVVGMLRVVSLLTSLMLLMAGGAYFIKSSPPPHVSMPPLAATGETSADTELPEGVGEIDSAEAADLAASLALLERAAADDREQEQQQAARAPAEPQPTAADPANAASVHENAPEVTREANTQTQAF